MGRRSILRGKIKILIDGKPEDDITIIYHNPVTGEAEVLYKSSEILTSKTSEK